MDKQKIVIAGASGFVGKNLIRELQKEDVEIIALSRSLKKSEYPNVKWVRCDCFSTLDLENAMQGADSAIYLIHSMQPTAKLDQANFMDYDLLIADNFGRTARKLGINKVVYLSGIIPEVRELSPHLESRLEVEKVFQSYFSQYSILRAGLILGKNGSSFNILTNLIKRLPVLVCPKWAKNQMGPIHIDKIVEALKLSILKPEYQGVYDLASKDDVSYLTLMQSTAEILRLKRKFFSLNINFNKLSRLWVSVVTGASQQLVYPLIESLNHNMQPDRKRLFPFKELNTTKQGLIQALTEAKGHHYSFNTRPIKRKTARSIQRFELPTNYTAEDVADSYMEFLPKFLFPFIRVTITTKDTAIFSFIHKDLKLLILRRNPSRSTSDKQVFNIIGGLLAANNDAGRFEFREVLNKKYILAAVHDFEPALPWFLYRYGQAIVHGLVMARFGAYLKSKFYKLA